MADNKLTKKYMTEVMSECDSLMELISKANEFKKAGAKPEYVNAVLGDCRRRLVNKTRKVDTLKTTPIPEVKRDKVGFIPINPVDVNSATM